MKRGLDETAEQVSDVVLGRLAAALQASSYSYTSGKTHNFYHYPARFSPDIARCVVEHFSRPGDAVIDPFMGGGTSVIEALSTGRRIIGVDINSLAHFVADVRTTPLSPRDEDSVRRWAVAASTRLATSRSTSTAVKNLPATVAAFVASALTQAQGLQSHRQRAFARCALLRLGQWSLDCRDFAAPRWIRLAVKLPELVDEMLHGLREFVDACRARGMSKRAVVKNRLLLHRTAVGLDQDLRLTSEWAKPRLVFTSPPYPSVHVLYHRWQYRGRRETGAPYWIANVPDGFYESYYRGGSRTPTGERRYFEMITAAFKSIRALIDADAWVVQLIGFADTQSQLPRYLNAMERAGFAEIVPRETGRRFRRQVPNRKWYAKLQGTLDASSEVLLFHKAL